MDIRLEDLSPRHVASVRMTTKPQLLRRTVAMVQELAMAAVGEQGLAPAGPLFARFHSSGDVVDLEAGVPLAQPITPAGVVRAGMLPGGPILVATVDGDQRPTDRLRSQMVVHALRQGYGIRGAAWEYYLVDERDTPIRSEWQTEICLPVSRAPARLEERDRATIRIDVQGPPGTMRARVPAAGSTSPGRQGRGTPA